MGTRSFNSSVDEHVVLPGEEAIIRIPENLNTFQLSKILDEDPLELLKIIHEQTNEIITDEF